MDENIPTNEIEDCKMSYNKAKIFFSKLKQTKET
jgi:hypothetical protein